MIQFHEISVIVTNCSLPRSCCVHSLCKLTIGLTRACLKMNAVIDDLLNVMLISKAGEL